MTIKENNNSMEQNLAESHQSSLDCQYVSLRSLPKTVGFAEKNFSYQKNGNSENGRVGRLHREKCQKNTHSANGRVGRLCIEKCQKNGNGMLKK